MSVPRSGRARRSVAVALTAVVLAACSSTAASNGSDPAGPATDPPKLGAPTEGFGVVQDAVELGTFTGTDIWIDPVDGDDARNGHDRASAMRTVNAAWERIPAGATLTSGFRLRLVAGT